MSQTVKIGKFEIAVPPKHILLQPGLPQTYDYVPWNLIGQIIIQAGMSDCRLIDIGANAGDSLAFFRRFSNAPALCVEPDKGYFSLLQENSGFLGNAHLLNGLVTPDHLVGKTVYSADGQTGFSRPAEPGEEVWKGLHISSKELMGWSDGWPFVIKTDTDGFDAQILKSVIPYLGRQMVPIIFFEGPSPEQCASRTYAQYLDICTSLQDLGFKLLLLTNIGLPYAYAGNNKFVLQSCFEALSIGYDNNRSLAHYFDIIALHPGIISPLHSLTSPWTDDIYSRS